MVGHFDVLTVQAFAIFFFIFYGTDGYNQSKNKKRTSSIMSMVGKKGGKKAPLSDDEDNESIDIDRVNQPKKTKSSAMSRSGKKASSSDDDDNVLVDRPLVNLEYYLIFQC